jgi:hydroxyethylthiazole kinase
MATTLVAAFLAVEPDAWLATTAGLVAMGRAGEIAAAKAAGPGTFRANLLDAVAALDEQTFAEGQKVSIA